MESHSCDVSTRSRKAGDNSSFRKTSGGPDNDRDGRCCLFCSPYTRCSASDDNVRIEAYQLSTEAGKSIILPLRKAVFNNNIMSFDVAKITKPWRSASMVSDGPSRANDKIAIRGTFPAFCAEAGCAETRTAKAIAKKMIFLRMDFSLLLILPSII